MVEPNMCAFSWPPELGLKSVIVAIFDVDLVVRGGGLRVLMQALLDGPRQMVEVLVSALIYVLDSPETRGYLRPGVELEVGGLGIEVKQGEGCDFKFIYKLNRIGHRLSLYGRLQPRGEIRRTASEQRQGHYVAAQVVDRDTIPVRKRDASDTKRGRGAEATI